MSQHKILSVLANFLNRSLLRNETELSYAVFKEKSGYLHPTICRDEFKKGIIRSKLTTKLKISIRTINVELMK